MAPLVEDASGGLFATTTYAFISFFRRKDFPARAHQCSQHEATPAKDATSAPRTQSLSNKQKWGVHRQGRQHLKTLRTPSNINGTYRPVVSTVSNNLRIRDSELIDPTLETLLELAMFHLLSMYAPCVFRCCPWSMFRYLFRWSWIPHEDGVA